MNPYPFHEELKPVPPELLGKIIVATFQGRKKPVRGVLRYIDIQRIRIEGNVYERKKLRSIKAANS